MFHKFKSFYNKEGYDTSEGLVDPFKYHNTFYYILKAFHVAESGTKRPYFNQNLFIFVTESIGIIFSLISLYHGVMIFEIPHITEAGTYVLILSYAILILSCTKLNLPQYNNLLQAMRDDFNYVCTTGSKYRKRFFVNQLETWKVSIFSMVFTGGIGVGMNLFAAIMLFYYLATHKPGEEGSRPLVFPFWIKGVDFDATPIYEIFFFYSYICVTAYAYNYIFMIQTQIVWVRHIATKADLVVWSIEDLLVDIHPTTINEEKQFYAMLIKRRMREIVIKHQSMYSLMEDYCETYKKLLMFEQKCCGPVICLTAYCLAEKLDEGEFHAILLLLFIATIVLYFIPSYLCTFIAVKANSICDACWNIPFWDSVPTIRPYMVLIMQRSLRSLNLHAPGFEDISIETFSQKMSSAYSCFNMLRQANR